MIVRIGEVKNVRKRYRSARIGYATGTFDLMHGGHLDYLEWAKSQCDKLFVYIRSDKRVAEVKGRIPLVPETDRARIIDQFKFVSFTYIGVDFLGSSKPSIELAKVLEPDMILIGNGWSSEVAAWKAALPTTEMRIYDKPHRDSTTRIINQVRSTDS